MKISTSTPLYKLATPEGTQFISQPCLGDQIAVSSKAGHFSMPQPIIGWARGTDSELSLYTAGRDSSLFRLALEEGCEDEVFFSGKVPDTLCEYRLDEYAPGALLYFPVPLAMPALMNVSRMQIAA
ncbi:hypothetical protein [Hymenobacter sp. YC55]|uniref:hypothetical protein n=1 Tax=Hymenobacter sp. YC55 TaxID=3034019 RepID=UPI0023F911D6|nr:hypothetical protein [Hymenobacter sp. YC55]MDF7810737.1 hypothetical protein [Hymenobacter sp. YC55]